MDPASACRLAIKVPAYVEQKPDGFGDYHVTENWMRAVDKDTFNWMGFHALLDEEIVHGQDQELQVTYLDKNTNETTRINSDSSLLHAFDMYWDKRKLPVTVEVVDTRAWDTMGKQFPDSVVDDPPQPLDVIMPADNAHNPDTDATPEDANPEDATPEVDTPEDEAEGEVQDDDSDESDLSDKPDEAKADSDEDWGENDEVEYVGVDDEKEKYRDELADNEAEGGYAYYPDTDEEDGDPLTVNDAEECDGVVHVTDLENPKIAVGVTFEDGFLFKRCIRQYAVLKEVELAVPYSESRRYRAYCKAKRCKWRIHASQCADGKTWKVLQSIASFTLYCFIYLLH
jgi:hypothetical protein